MSNRPGRPESSLRRRAVALASLLALIALAVGALFGDRGLLHLLGERERAEQLQAEIEELRTENGRLAGEILGLRRDPRAIERLAREELGLSRPGEIVFVLREEPRR